MICLPTPFQPCLPTASIVASNPLPSPLPTPGFHHPHTPIGVRTPLERGCAPFLAVIRKVLTQ